MTDAQAYMHHRAESAKAFTAGDGAAATGHAMAAHNALRRYATAHGLTTDDAAARIRREARR